MPNAKVAAAFAAGVLLSAGIAAGSLIWTWQERCEPRLDRLDRGTDANAEAVARLQRTWSEQRERDAGALAGRLQELETTVDKVHEQLKPLRLIQAVPGSATKPRPPHSVAVLTPAELAGNPTTEDAADRLYASLLINNLTGQPLVRVTPSSALAACKFRGQGGEKYPWSNGQEAGQVLGVQFVLTCTASEKQVGSFPNGHAELYLHVELIAVESGALAHAYDWVVRQGLGVGPGKPSWAGEVGDPLRDMAQTFGRKVRHLSLEPRLPAVLRGEDKPANAPEQVTFAALAYQKAFYATSARLYADAFAADPSLAGDPRTATRYDAACSAARAGCGQGNDAAEVTDEERGRWRERARGWLRADLVLRTQPAAGKADKDRAEVREKLEWWQKDKDLAGVRDPDAIKALPDEEARAWRQLWADVEALLQRRR